MPIQYRASLIQCNGSVSKILIQFSGAFYYKVNNQYGRFSFPWNVTSRMVSSDDFPIQLFGLGKKISITAQDIQRDVPFWSPQPQWIAASQHPLQEINLSALQVNCQIITPLELTELNSKQVHIPLNHPDLSNLVDFKIPDFKNS